MLLESMDHRHFGRRTSVAAIADVKHASTKDGLRMHQCARSMCRPHAEMLLIAGMMSYSMMTFSAYSPATGPACLQILNTLLWE